jgi:REP element-mobilizing transposase RayT
MKLLHNPYRYRRFLPHIQDSVPLFIRFGTADRWILPHEARDIVMECCLFKNGSWFHLHAAVVMPEHVHLLLSLLYNEVSDPMPLYQVLANMKSVSAHKINRLLQRKGRVWQEESFDRATRADEFQHYLDYIQANPVKRRLVGQSADYRWLWFE